MPPKKQIPAPIDRPLSRAYLREFTGWSTEFPPGLSDSTSLRIMENILINRDGAARIRPGLRYLSYSQVPDINEVDPGLAIENQVVGTHETFFLNDGSLAYLFAVREDDDTVGFRVLVRGVGDTVVQGLTDVGIDFSIPQGEAALNFTADTTYVKYLQIDNKVFALSNAGETMRMFTVGSVKTARRLSAIDRPAWSVADKLTVVHPDAAWIDNGLPSLVRTNLLRDPSQEYGNSPWGPGAAVTAERSTTLARTGLWSTAVETLPSRTNWIPYPLDDPATDGLTGWSDQSANVSSISEVSNNLQAACPAGTVGRFAPVQGPLFAIEGDFSYRVSLDLNTISVGSTPYARIKFFNASNVQIGSDWDMLLQPVSGTRKATAAVAAPSGAVRMRVNPMIQINRTTSAVFAFKNVLVSKEGEAITAFTGDSGADYSWVGAANASASIYHPPVTAELTGVGVSVTEGQDYAWSIYARSASTARAVSMGVVWVVDGVASAPSWEAAPTNDASGAWTRISNVFTAPAGATDAFPMVRIAAVPSSEIHYIDDGLLEKSSSVGTYFDGDTTDTTTTVNDWIVTGDGTGQQSTQIVYTSTVDVPAAETRTANTLISNVADNNDFNFGFFYTFSNEIGETAPSQVAVVTAQRPWAGWAWETPNAAGEPSGTETNDPDLCADQLVAFMPEDVFDQALLEGAVSWTLYMCTWSDQDPVPATAVRIAAQTLTSASVYETHGWLRMTPQQVGSTELTVTLPSMSQRQNYSDPSRGGQGIVAADRMVLVLDPTEQARIKWSSNLQGSYTDFTANKGGGFKTLTTGNLFIPACVKLWQNPQSVDTLTILCMGTDGRSTGYYMQPAQIASQSDAVNIMGFEETTATPGTTSPFGCEVWNNALYHPLDDQLMKSTANNYNIAHKAQTDQIATTWSLLVNKHRIVSSQLDGRLYFIVHNPTGAELEDGARGNEVWVFDAKAENGTWSRWLVQGVALRTIERGGRVYMSIVRPDGLYYFDPDYGLDDVVVAGEVLTQAIPWRLETNTQGANRAHDAWAHLQQLNIAVGNFVGKMRYGIRSWDLNGQPVDISALLLDNNDEDDPLYERDRGLPYDLEAYLLIQRDLKEWIFYAESVTEDDLVQPSFGQINLVQYRYTPSTVNTGYEWGSVETFEYQRGGLALSERTTHNGVPMPYIDTRRP